VSCVLTIAVTGAVSVDIAIIPVRVPAFTDVVAAKERQRIDKPTSAKRFMGDNLLVV
jgi:hypothetical protein